MAAFFHTTVPVTTEKYRLWHRQSYPSVPCSRSFLTSLFLPLKSYICIMDVINSHYSEVESSLSFIDKEYDIPQVRDAVHFLLQEEMNRFAPSSSYLKHLPYPSLKFANSPMLQAEYARVRDGAAPTMTKLDTKRYAVDAPEPAMERDVQAWRSAVANGKAQTEHQINRIMNLELADAHIGSVWLSHNKSLEGYEKQLIEQTELVKRKIGTLSATRRREQESVQPELKKFQARTSQALWTNWQVAEACTNMEQYLLSQGVTYNGEEEKKIEEVDIEVDEVVEEEEEKEEENSAMKI